MNYTRKNNKIEKTSCERIGQSSFGDAELN
jgi:hypothetical protein